MKPVYTCIGIMTGNSLDAVDAVLTRFEGNEIRDLCGHSIDIPAPMAENFRRLKQILRQNDGDINAVSEMPKLQFQKLHNSYIKLVARTVNELIAKSGIAETEIDIIGFHGQTCYHLPPSVAPKGQQPNTLQIGSGQMLSDLTGIPVAFDFRSDDLMNGGEAAPFAPVHNRHLAEGLKAKGLFPLAFCNGGNTGNIAIVYDDKVTGWDTGPFNHLVDFLTRTEKNEPCDFDGKYGKRGKIDIALLRELFEHAVRTQNGSNFLLKEPPKSSDPAWYRIIPELTDKNIPFEDRIRTAEFFSAYIFTYTLRFSPVGTPDNFLVFGGGWNNPIIMEDFKSLLRGETEILPEHQKTFAKIKNPKAQVEWSDKCGCNGKYMEARIFADMAKCLLTKEPFSFPETTGCKKPTVGGILVRPGDKNPLLWSRAARGWSK